MVPILLLHSHPYCFIILLVSIILLYEQHKFNIFLYWYQMFFSILILLYRTKMKRYLQMWKGCLKNTTKWYPSLHKALFVNARLLCSKCEKGLSLVRGSSYPYTVLMWLECLCYKLLVYLTVSGLKLECVKILP